MTIEENAQKKEVNVGVIGCGRIGIVHLGAISKAPGVKAVIVSNPTVSKAEAAAKQFNVPRFTSDAMEVITDPEVDAVWICSPSSFHAEQIKACAANGKHVFCEKPLATDLAETVEAINACNEANVKLMTGLQRRFDPNFRRVRDAVESNEVGDTVMVSPHFIVNTGKDDVPVVKSLLVFVILNQIILDLIFWLKIILSCLLYNHHDRSSCALVTLHPLHLSTSKVVEVFLLIWQCMISICPDFWLVQTLLIFWPLVLVTLTNPSKFWMDPRNLTLPTVLFGTLMVYRP